MFLWPNNPGITPCLVLGDIRLTHIPNRPNGTSLSVTKNLAPLFDACGMRECPSSRSPLIEAYCTVNFALQTLTKVQTNTFTKKMWPDHLTRIQKHHEAPSDVSLCFNAISLVVI